jgi:hypothetical protein
MQEAHDHLHELCMGGREAGREISKAHLDKLGLAHDHMAAAIGASCRYHQPSGGEYRAAPLQQNATKHSGAKPGADYKAREDMTEEEAVSLLETMGYTVKW